jgi:hypothetical protein
VWAGLLWALPALTVLAADPVVDGPLALDNGTTPSQGVRIAALGTQWVVVGWTVEAGPNEGVYLRQRVNWTWEPVQRIGDSPAATGREPRDLDLAFDARGRLHAVWTARRDGPRVVMHALAPGVTAPTRIQSLQDLASEHGDADFPRLDAAPDGSMLLVWQESEALTYGVRAARLPSEGAMDNFLGDNLGSVSGDALAGLAPQILTVEPPRVAWYEIGESGSHLRVEEWQPAEGRWRPSALEWMVRAFPAENQVLLHATPEGLAASWAEAGEDGRGTIKLGWLPARAIESAQAPTVDMIVSDEVEPRRQSLSGSLPAGLTLAWQTPRAGVQRVELVRGLGDGQPVEHVTVSTGAQRYAASPDHVTQGNWSAVVWIDDARDGGDGAVYFSQVQWPSRPPSTQ